MPETYVREMVADWMGASRLYTGDWNISDWLAENLPRMKLHPNTLGKVVSILYLQGLIEIGPWGIGMAMTADPDTESWEEQHAQTRSD